LFYAATDSLLPSVASSSDESSETLHLAGSVPASPLSQFQAVLGLEHSVQHLSGSCRLLVKGLG